MSSRCGLALVRMLWARRITPAALQKIRVNKRQKDSPENVKQPNQGSEGSGSERVQ